MEEHRSAPLWGTKAVFTPWYRALTIAAGWLFGAVTWIVSTADGGQNLAWVPALVLGGITVIWFEGGSVRAVARRVGLGPLVGPPPSGRP